MLFVEVLKYGLPIQPSDIEARSIPKFHHNTRFCKFKRLAEFIFADFCEENEDQKSCAWNREKISLYGRKCRQEVLGRNFTATHTWDYLETSFRILFVHVVCFSSESFASNSG